ncbi:replication protein A 70 kDa DNA-binding subunit C-like [Lotus japonicus]|uniref:replication protein A 70 kDa DNA-binding subunit C-like n=1 Tax=Lotus japonicus TaxID=34305 RepID=UPI002590C9CE|nr:replication protein A 70 kDa DNA-binding subunit C-like [Lotus japonicus]
MANSFSLGIVNALCPPSQIWSVIVRVVRLWTVYTCNGNGVPKSVEIILMDQYGGKIQCSLRREMYVKWGQTFMEGNVYKITFGRLVPNLGPFRATEHPFKILLNHDSIVVPCENTLIPMWGLSLKNSEQVNMACGRSDCLVDFIGLLTCIVEERTCVKKGKMGRVQCVLFEEHAKFVTDYLSIHSTEEAILVFQLAKIKKFRGKSVLQGVVGATRLSFNPQIPEVLSFWNEIMVTDTQFADEAGFNMIENSVVSVYDDFIKNHPRKTVKSLNETIEDGDFVVRAKIVTLLEDDSWWYLACKCSRAVMNENGHYYCSGCFRLVNYVAPRFRIKLQVSDGVDSADFVMPDSIAENLLKKTCSQMLNEVEDPNCTRATTVMQEGLVGRDLLFKVEKNLVNVYNFEDPYTVKRVCDDFDLMEVFMANSSVETLIMAKFPSSFSELNLDDYEIDMELLGSPPDLVVPVIVKPAIERSTTEYGGCSKSFKRKLEDEFVVEEEFQNVKFKECKYGTD